MDSKGFKVDSNGFKVGSNGFKMDSRWNEPACPAADAGLVLAHLSLLRPESDSRLGSTPMPPEVGGR